FRQKRGKAVVRQSHLNTQWLTIKKEKSSILTMRFIDLRRENGKTPFDTVINTGCGPTFVLNRKKYFFFMIKEQILVNVLFKPWMFIPRERTDEEVCQKCFELLRNMLPTLPIQFTKKNQSNLLSRENFISFIGVNSYQIPWFEDLLSPPGDEMIIPKLNQRFQLPPAPENDIRLWLREPLERKQGNGCYMDRWHYSKKLAKYSKNIRETLWLKRMAILRVDEKDECAVSLPWKFKTSSQENKNSNMTQEDAQTRYDSDKYHSLTVRSLQFHHFQHTKYKIIITCNVPASFVMRKLKLKKASIKTLRSLNLSIFITMIQPVYKILVRT
uniref:Uncharacterized protein n=1 Tax=Strigamia maritima TaxID=126957 RepID=T1IVM0_STRMM